MSKSKLYTASNYIQKLLNKIQSGYKNTENNCVVMFYRIFKTINRYTSTYGMICIVLYESEIYHVRLIGKVADKIDRFVNSVSEFIIANQCESF